MTEVCESVQSIANLNDALAFLQHEVQRKLGRCMIRLQQYERLLKAVIASMAVEGPFEQLHAKRAGQVANASDKSLGTLVRMFTSSHLIATPSDSDNAPRAPSSGSQSPDAAWASIRFNVEMSPERHAQTKEGLTELVALRNDLVHHLIERFDMSERVTLSYWSVLGLHRPCGPYPASLCSFVGKHQFKRVLVE